MTEIITDDDKALLLELARETITARLEKRKEKSFTYPSRLEKKLGAFVTLHKQGKLRGCIGNMVGYNPLHTTIGNMATAAAFEDPRFPALTANELDTIDIEISVLSLLKTITDINEIIVGTHGILLEAEYHTGVLLPQVAVEQGWDRITFLTNTCYKAGVPGDEWKKSSTTIKIFSAVIFGEKSE